MIRMTRFVYSLSDSDLVPRYIGQTRNVQRRLASHCSASSLKTPVAGWLKALSRSGTEPVVTVIASGDWTIIEAEEAEEAAITEAVAAGHPLLNVRLRAFRRAPAQRPEPSEVEALVVAEAASRGITVKALVQELTPKMTLVHMRLPQELIGSLDAEAKSKGTTRSEVARERMERGPAPPMKRVNVRG